MKKFKKPRFVARPQKNNEEESEKTIERDSPEGKTSIFHNLPLLIEEWKSVCKRALIEINSLITKPVIKCTCDAGSAEDAEWGKFLEQELGIIPSIAVVCECNKEWSLEYLGIKLGVDVFSLGNYNKEYDCFE